VETLVIFVEGIPRPQGSKRAFPIAMKNGKTRVVVTESAGKELAAWRYAVRERAKEAGGKMIPAGRPVWLSVLFYLPRPKSRKNENYHATRPDLDKLIRSALDSLTGVAYEDDSQVCDLKAEKHYNWDVPGASIDWGELSE
jgi:Holliday junction resolvase RusA-like endonuclease